MAFRQIGHVPGIDPFYSQVGQASDMLSTLTQNRNTRRAAKAQYAGERLRVLLDLSQEWRPGDWARNEGGLRQAFLDAGYDPQLAEMAISASKRRAQEQAAPDPVMAAFGSQMREAMATPNQTILPGLRGPSGAVDLPRSPAQGFDAAMAAMSAEQPELLVPLFERTKGMREYLTSARESEAERRRLERKEYEDALKKARATQPTRLKHEFLTEELGPEGARRALERLAFGPEKVEGVERPPALTPNAESQLIARLVRDWRVASEPVVDLHRQAKLMKVGMDQARKGNMVAGSQAVLVTFQKILDPTSVVRESEYARSASGLSLLNRVQGARDKLITGGAGVPLDELEGFVELANEAVDALSSGFVDSVKERIGLTADRYNVPRELVFEDFDFMAAESGAGAEPSPESATANARLEDTISAWQMKQPAIAEWARSEYAREVAAGRDPDEVIAEIQAAYEAKYGR